ncbi:MAG: D-aminoacylase [Chloroflexi bacterium]|nr:D-aminoacylase [Chloroflexota bacterium]
MLDLVIKNGDVYDGTGAPGLKVDIGIEGDRIVVLGDLSNAESVDVIDASGLAVSPGFVDLHTHSDNSFLIDPLADSKVRQGVTFELMGNCGMSYCAPLGKASIDSFQTRADRYGGLDSPWQDFTGWLDAVSDAGSTLNVAGLIGHNTLREYVMNGEARVPTLDELISMKREIETAIDGGALGFSTGLYFAPGSYSLTEEVIDLAQVAADRDVLYSTHPRSESNDGAGLFVAIEEAIEVGRRTGGRVQISHIKCNGTQVWGKAGRILEIIGYARSEGIDVSGDQYPYTISSADMGGVLFPRWLMAGSRIDVLHRLEDDDLRSQARQGMQESLERYQGPSGIIIANFPPDPSMAGRSLAEISDMMNVEPAEAALRVFEQADANAVLHSMSDADVDLISAAPYVSMGSDGSSLRTTGPLSAGQPHPRNYGASARYLARTVRERKVVTLAEGIHRMTGMPAERLHLKRRGRIAPGYFADIAIFNPDTVQDQATELEPHQYATGISHVVVNGAFSVRDGELTGATPGRVIRSEES